MVTELVCSSGLIIHLVNSRVQCKTTHYEESFNDQTPAQGVYATHGSEVSGYYSRSTRYPPLERHSLSLSSGLRLLLPDRFRRARRAGGRQARSRSEIHVVCAAARSGARDLGRATRRCRRREE